MKVTLDDVECRYLKVIDLDPNCYRLEHINIGSLPVSEAGITIDG